MPASVALLLIGHSIQLALFRYGETTAHDVQMSSYALAAISIGLSAFMLIKVLAPGFYARQDVRTPVRIGVIAMVANMVFNLILVVPLHMSLKMGHVGLALATALAAWVNAGLLARGLLKQRIYIPQPGWRAFALKLTLACTAMGALLWLADPGDAVWLGWSWWQRVPVLLALCGAGMAVYAGVLFAMGLRIKDLRGPSI
jgi:putative peptidoglycan lipid II flippase